MEKEFRTVKKFLSENNVTFEVTSHSPVKTSEEAAAARGVPMHAGAKALVVKTDKNDLILAVLPGDRKINFEKLASVLKCKKIKLASHDEVLQRTGCEVGSVHPLGSLFELYVYCDKKLLKNEVIYFNPGVHTKTIKMKAEDYIKITRPVLCDIAD